MNHHNIDIIKNFADYLTLERGMSANSIEAYCRDVDKLAFYAESVLKNRNFEEITTEELAAFIEWIARLGMKPRSQARILSAVKQLYRYLLFEDIIEDTPADTIQCPKMGMMLPNVLSVEEIDRIEAAVDLSTNEGERNRAIIETLYSCGLRVSELINLKLSDIHLQEGFIKITGKGNKTRIVPISGTALKYINFYIEKMRDHIAINNENKDYLFLNRRGRKLTRVMIFTIVKQLVEAAGIDKNVSPHTFRHSFATHLVEGGADLRAVQEMLGHESIQTTEIYTHLDSSYLRDEILTFHPRSDKRMQILDVTENIGEDMEAKNLQ
ncbi:MAG: site-specific tyrosine recombinase XerD [Bacteroidales bacterium]|nr:site-specific tyrosine recombinase XerD [Bacteroidales bacterium]